MVSLFEHIAALEVSELLLSYLKEILLNLEAAIDSYNVPSDKGITKPGM